MKFNNEKALNQLLTKKIVATMRNYHYTVGTTVTINGNHKAEVLAVFKNVKTFRKSLLRFSGFESVEEWEETAKQLHGNMPKYIILLRLVKA